MRVEYYAERDEKIDIFKRVGHEIGSNATGTRNWYINYALIRQARDELNLQSLVAQRLNHMMIFKSPFLLLNSKNLKSFYKI